MSGRGEGVRDSSTQRPKSVAETYQDFSRIDQARSSGNTANHMRDVTRPDQTHRSGNIAEHPPDVTRSGGNSKETASSKGNWWKRIKRKLRPGNQRDSSTHQGDIPASQNTTAENNARHDIVERHAETNTNDDRVSYPTAATTGTGKETTSHDTKKVVQGEQKLSDSSGNKSKMAMIFEEAAKRQMERYPQETVENKRKPFNFSSNKFRSAMESEYIRHQRETNSDASSVKGIGTSTLQDTMLNQIGTSNFSYEKLLGLSKVESKHGIDALDTFINSKSGKIWIESKYGEDFLSKHLHDFLATKAGKALYEEKGAEWQEKTWFKSTMFHGYLLNHLHDFLGKEEGKTWWKGEKGQAWQKTVQFNDYLDDHLLDFYKTEEGKQMRAEGKI